MPLEPAGVSQEKMRRGFLNPAGGSGTRAKAEKTLLETVKRLEVSEANVRYFKDRRGCGEADRELTLESVFDIFVGGSE